MQHRHRRQGRHSARSAAPNPASSVSSACSPINFPRALDIARELRAAGVTGGDRRLPRERLPLDAAGNAARSEGGARSRRHPVRRRRRGPRRRAAARDRRRQDQADLQLSERHAGDGGGDAADPAALGGDPRRRALYQFRCRPRLSVPVQLLHHHQRAGAQVALPHARRRRGHRARQCGAGHHPLLRHRRQFRAQQELGADPRPPDRAARAARLQHQAPVAGGHALPPHSQLHPESGARRLHCRVHRAREHQSRIADGHEEAAEQDLGIPRHAAGLEARPR